MRVFIRDIDRGLQSRVNVFERLDCGYGSFVGIAVHRLRLKNQITGKEQNFYQRIVSVSDRRVDDKTRITCVTQSALKWKSILQLLIGN